MGERNTLQLCKELESGKPVKDIHDIPQTVYLCNKADIPGGITDNDIVLHSQQ